MTRLRTHNRRALCKRLSQWQIEQREGRRIVRLYRRGYPRLKLFYQDVADTHKEACYSITGRLVNPGPEMQRLPGQRASDRVLVDIDYSDIERRVFSGLTPGLDPHAATMIELGVDRPRAKIINYAKLYGLSGANLFKKLTERKSP